MTIWICVGLVAVAAFLGGWNLHYKIKEESVGRLSITVVKVTGFHAVALLWVIGVVGWTEDVVEAVRLLG